MTGSGTPEVAGGGGWRRIRHLAAWRVTPGTIGVALLCGVLGFATVAQVRSQDDSVLDRSRRDQLVQILDEVSQRSTRLEQEVAQLERTRDELRGGVDRRAVALAEARNRARALSVLAGTVPVRGPGIVLTVADPKGAFGAPGLLGAVQELRAADAEAIAISGGNGRSARVVVSTAFAPAPRGVEVGGVVLSSPYRIFSIGDPATLAGAMRFPRGVIAQVTAPDVGGTASVDERPSVDIRAVVPGPAPSYASPPPASPAAGG